MPYSYAHEHHNNYNICYNNYYRVEVSESKYEHRKGKGDGCRQHGQTPVKLHRDYTQLARLCEISHCSVGSPKNAENRCKSFLIFTRWICYGVHTAMVAFLRSPRGVGTSRSRRVLVDVRMRAHGVFIACSLHARNGHCAQTALTLRCLACPKRSYCVCAE